MSKNTAVDWLIREIRNHMIMDSLDAITISILKMQAKAMEREQIEDAFNQEKIVWVTKKHDDGTMSLTNEIAYNNAADYYTETYKGGGND